MKHILFAFLLLISSAHADVKISQLPLGSAASTNVNDSFPYVSSTANATQRLKLSDLINLPQMVATYAPLASPTFTGTVTAPTIVLSSAATIGYCWEATSTGGAGAWAACSSFVNPMSAVGDLIYGGASGAATRLAANTSATKAFLTETGTGSAGQAPSWQLGLSSGDIPNNAANTTGSAGSLTQSLTVNEPVIGNGTGITVGTKSGNTTDFATANGALTSGDCLQADANGNIQTTGSACGSAGGGVTAVGTYNSQTSSANGAVISGSDIYFQPFTSTNPGMAPASGGGTTNFLRADGTWAAPSGGGGTPGGANTDLQYNSSGSFGGNANATTDGLGNFTLAGKISATTANLSSATASTPAIFDSSKNLASGSYSGNTTELCTVSGTKTSGDIVQFDSSGNCTDSSTAVSSILSNPMTTAGDMIYGGASGVPTRLPAGASGQIPISAGSTVAFGALSTIGSSVTSSDTAHEYRIEEALVNCASPSTITQQSGSWVSSIASESGGSCVVTIASNTFNTTPVCLAGYNTNNPASGVFVTAGVSSATSMTISCYSGGPCTTFATNIICMGPHS